MDSLWFCLLFQNLRRTPANFLSGRRFQLAQRRLYSTEPKGENDSAAEAQQVDVVEKLSAHETFYWCNVTTREQKEGFVHNVGVFSQKPIITCILWSILIRWAMIPHFCILKISSQLVPALMRVRKAKTCEGDNSWASSSLFFTLLVLLIGGSQITSYCILVWLQNQNHKTFYHPFIIPLKDEWGRCLLLKWKPDRDADRRVISRHLCFRW